VTAADSTARCRRPLVLLVLVLVLVLLLHRPPTWTELRYYEYWGPP
jgi:hypothetical protein